MELTSLSAVSPIDGRYRKQTEILGGYFSEQALIKYRLWVEVEYFIALCELPLPQIKSVKHEVFGSLRKIYWELTDEETLRIKELEKTTNHDVKAVEYFIKEKFDTLGLAGKIRYARLGGVQRIYPLRSYFSRYQ